MMYFCKNNFIESILITPKNKFEIQLLTDLMKKMNIQSKLISEEEQEDLGLIKLMKKANRTQKTEIAKDLEILDRK